MEVTETTITNFSSSSIQKINIKISKFISLVLRHNPSAASLSLDESGWADCNQLIQAIRTRYKVPSFTIEDLNLIVNLDNKKRYTMSSDNTLIRANQGHSLKTISFEFPLKRPPQRLFHGTSSKFEESIDSNGLLKMNRHHVHLSDDIKTAINVGKRHGGKLVIYAIRSDEMANNSSTSSLISSDADTNDEANSSYCFYLSENNVWLTDHVPPQYLIKLTEDDIDQYILQYTCNTINK